nr:hypothetical protein [Pseudonocardia sp. ICBG1293]
MTDIDAADFSETNSCAELFRPGVDIEGLGHYLTHIGMGVEEHVCDTRQDAGPPALLDVAWVSDHEVNSAIGSRYCWVWR